MECSDNDSGPNLVLALLRLIWSEVKARVGVEFFLAITVAICAFWSIAEAHLGYSPNEFFYAILNSYTASLSWLRWPIHQAITALGIKIILSNTWLHIVALGMFYVSTDALLMQRTGRGKGYAIVLYCGSLILLIVAGVLIDVVLATFREGWLKELSLLWLWVGTISLLEIYDVCLTISKRSVREEWSRVYGISPEEPLRLVSKSLSRLFQHQVLWPLVGLSVLILALYSDGSPSEGFIAVGIYLLYMVVYWPIWDIICFRRNGHEQAFIEFMEHAYHWRFGLALLMSAIAVIVAGIALAAKQ